MVAAWILVMMLASLLVWFVADTEALLTHYGLTSVLLGLTWDPERGQLGLMPFIWGSVVVGALALLVSTPLGISLALVTTRRMPRSIGHIVLAGLTALVAVPSVIFGWWGLDAVVPWVRHAFGGPGFSLLAAGLTLAVMILPTLTVLSAAAIRAIPENLEEASRALGATEDQTLWRITVQAAAPGIVRALILATGRALAETMAVQMVIGSQPEASLHLTWPGSTLTTGILTNLSLYPPGTWGAKGLTAMAFVLLIGTWWLSRELKHWEAQP